MAHRGESDGGDGSGEARILALGVPGALEAMAFARAADGPFTVDAAAGALGVDRTVARRRLDRLEAAGLLTSEFRRPGGRGGPGAGRPPRLFRTTPERAVTEYPTRRYAELVARLAAAPAPGARGPALREVGRRYAADLAGRVPAGRATRLDRVVPQVCARLGRLGFQARPMAASADRAELRVPLCPLRPAVVAGPAAAEVDRGMWEGLVGPALSRRLRVHCMTEGCLDEAADCTVTLSLERGSEHE